MNDNNYGISELDYEPTGSVGSASKAARPVFYTVAVLFVIAGIIVYFAVIPWVLILVLFVFFAVLFVFLGAAEGKNIWYWGKEKFTVIRFLSKTVTYSYDEIETIFTVNQYPIIMFMLHMKNGKEYGFSTKEKGAEEFIEYLDSIWEKKYAENG